MATSRTPGTGRTRTPTSNSRSSADSIAKVVPKGDLRSSLLSIRDRLAQETDDLKWSRHKRECNCVCGMTDPRALVALTKRLEETLAAIAALPAPSVKESAVDGIRAGAAKRRDELAARRASRAAGAPAS